MFGLKCQPLEGELADHHALLHKYLPHALLHKYLPHARALCVCVYIYIYIWLTVIHIYLIKLKELECLV